MAKLLNGCIVQLLEKYLIFSLLSAFLLSCDKKNEQPVVIVTYQFDKIRSKDSTILTILEGEDYKELFFGMEELPDKSISALSPSVKIFSTTDTTIMYKDVRVYLKASKIYQVQGKKRKINRYNYDVEGSMDEEENVYISDDGRLIGATSLAWDLYKIYDYQDTTIDSLLQADNSGFFYEWRKNKE